jgi:hypothetical protein
MIAGFDVCLKHHPKPGSHNLVKESIAIHAIKKLSVKNFQKAHW